MLARVGVRKRQHYSPRWQFVKRETLMNVSLLLHINSYKDDKSENIRTQFNLSDQIELIAADFLMSKPRTEITKNRASQLIFNSPTIIPKKASVKN